MRLAPLAVSLAAAAPLAASIPPRGASEQDRVVPHLRARTGVPEHRSDALVVRLRDGGAPASAAAVVAADAIAHARTARVEPVFGPAPADARGREGQTRRPTGVFRLGFAKPIDTVAAARALARDPRVAWAEPVYRAEAAATTNDPYLLSSGAWGQPYGDLWGLAAMGAPTAWDVTLGSNVMVAVVDTGSDLTHVDLAANLAPVVDPPNGIDDDDNGFVDDTYGWDFVNDDSDPTDDDLHGTHVAGTIAAVGNNGTGIVGVAWGARILSVKALSAGGFGDSDDLAAAILYAVDRGARVINMSWGMYGHSQVIEDALEEAHAAGVVLVAAAGNDYTEATYFNPCSSRFVVCAGAQSPTNQRAWFSNYGSTVDLLAPGGSDAADWRRDNVLSLFGAGLGPHPNAIAGSYLRLEGTTMASAHAAGAAALLLAGVPGIAAEQVRQAMRRSAAPAYAAGWDVDSGYGRLAVDAAIADAAAGRGSARILSRVVDLSAGGPVVGIADCAGFASWQLAVGAGNAPASWTTVHSSASAVATAGTLVTWDPGVLAEGIYTLRLTVVGAGGRTYEDRLELVLDRVHIRTPVANSSFRGGDVVAITGSAVVPGMTSYEVQYLDPWKPGGDTWHTIGSGAGPVANGLLATWNTAGLTHASHYQLQIVVHLGGGGEELSAPDYYVVVDPTLHAGWPRPLPVEPEWQGLYIDQNATVADLDGDGLPEMVLAQGTTIHAFRHDGSEAAGWPQTVPSEHRTQRSPAVGDLDGDGLPEVVVGSNAWAVLIYEHDGTLRALGGSPQFQAMGRYAAIDDVAGDARKEIVVTGPRLPSIVILDHLGGFVSGPPLGNCPMPTPAGSVFVSPSPPALADLDGDGKAEIVVLQRQGRLQLYVCRGDGTPLPGFPVDLGPSIDAAGTGAPVVGDVDGDGRLDLVVASSQCALSALDWHGQMLPGFPWQPPFATSYCGPVALADLDGDRAVEVLLGALSDEDPGGGLPVDGSVMWAIDGDGQLRPGWPRSFGDGHPAGGPIVADLDGDGRREIAVDGDKRFPVHGVEADGSELPGFPKPTVAPQLRGVFNAPAIADFDGDGLLELFWVSSKVAGALDGQLLGRLYLWDLTAPALPTAFDWPMYRHDAAHTGAQLGAPCAPGACSPSLPFFDGFETGNQAAWAPSPR